METARRDSAGFLAEPDFTDLTLGIQRFQKSFDPARLFDFRICNTDSTRVTKLDYFAPKVVVCSNLVDNSAQLRKEEMAALVKLYDFYSRAGAEPTCGQLVCSTVRALHLSKICRELRRDQRVSEGGGGGGGAAAGGVPGGGAGAGAAGGAGGVPRRPVSIRPVPLGDI